MTHIINISLTTGTFPSDWKKSKVIPVYKSGSKSDIENYRPISVIPAASKVIEKIVHEQLYTYMEDNSLLNKCQFGFRRSRSTETAATLFFDSVKRLVNDNGLAGAIFIDLCKAFDTIGHSQLIHKLKLYGVNDTELAWFTDYLFCRQQQVLYNDSLCEPDFVLNGVPQGSILGPLLFIIYFNDLPLVLSHSQIIKYADDTVIYVSDKSLVEIERKLSIDMTSIEKWCNDNDLILNFKKGKTEAMLFGSKQMLAKCKDGLNITFQGRTLTTCVNYKYLGIVIDGTLNMNKNFDIAYKKASGRLRLLVKLRSMLTSQAAKTVYQSMVVPLLTYCALSSLQLSNTNELKLESFHRRAVSIIDPGDEKLLTITAIKKIRACLFVRKCLDNNVCVGFKDHFDIITNSCTRNNQCLLRLPKLKREYYRGSLQYTGAKLYNELNMNIRKTENFIEFKKLLMQAFS